LALDLAKEIRDRRTGFTPDWTEPVEGDAGSALVSVFADLASQVRGQLNRLPDKTLVEFFHAAGVLSSPARAAEAIVQFTVAPTAPQSILVPKGFQLGAKPNPQSGQTSLVVFETQNNLNVAPADIDAVVVTEGAINHSVTLSKGVPDRPFPALGIEPHPGDALSIGLKGTAAPTTSITLGIRLAAADGTALPVAFGGIEQPAEESGSLLSWEAYSRGSFQAIEVLRDETRGLTQSGLIELSVPANWDPGVIFPAGDPEPLHWFRVRLLQGQFITAPVVAALDFNVVSARAVQTISDEILTPIEDSNPTQMTLSKTPVVPGSLILEVTGALPGGITGVAERWDAVDDLSAFGPDNRVFTLDPDRGVVTFGDGMHGAAVPSGFRNVRAVSYEVGGGLAGAVDAGAVSTLLNTAEFLTGVINPRPATGGINPAASDAIIRVAPQVVRTRGRAVTVADYALMARSAEGAQVSRALAISGMHPSFPGSPIPGTVNVIVVPPISGDGPPLPDDGTLTAVARYLTETVAPLGVEVVASSPSYLIVDTEVAFVAQPGANIADTILKLIKAISGYLHPLTGGDSGDGWPFGKALSYSALLRRLMDSVPNLSEIPILRLTINGVPQPPCSDVALDVGELFWPRNHNVFPRETEVRP
jgi:predicted phage baseplate assembly protein